MFGRLSRSFVALLAVSFALTAPAFGSTPSGPLDSGSDNGASDPPIGPGLQLIDPSAPLPPSDLTPLLLQEGLSIFFGPYDPSAPLPTGDLAATVTWIDIVSAVVNPSQLLALMFPAPTTPPPPTTLLPLLPPPGP